MEGKEEEGASGSCGPAAALSPSPTTAAWSGRKHNRQTAGAAAGAAGGAQPLSWFKFTASGAAAPCWHWQALLC